MEYSRTCQLRVTDWTPFEGSPGATSTLDIHRASSRIFWTVLLTESSPWYRESRMLDTSFLASRIAADKSPIRFSA